MTEDARVALLREGFAAYERGDVEGTMSMLHPEIEVYAPPEVGNAGTFHGRDGWLAWQQNWVEAWESFQQEVTSIEPAGERHALVDSHQTARGRGSGVEVELDVTYVYEIRDGLAVYQGLYLDHDAALADAQAREARE